MRANDRYGDTGTLTFRGTDRVLQECDSVVSDQILLNEVALHSLGFELR